MSIELKEENLLSLLSPNVATPIRVIAKKLYVSEPTARRYVNALAKKGSVIRTHGGCMPNAVAFDRNTPMYIRFASENAIKKKIAERAAEFIPADATIFLDSSSTVFQILPFLRFKQNLIVVTSSIKTAMALSEMGIKTMCLGGFINNANLSMNSAFAMESVRQINADIFFFSCDALSKEGELTDNSYEECLLRKEFIKHSKKSVLLLDSTKLGKKCKYNLGTIKDVDCCISNEGEKIVVL